MPVGSATAKAAVIKPADTTKKSEKTVKPAAKLNFVAEQHNIYVKQVSNWTGLKCVEVLEVDENSFVYGIGQIALFAIASLGCAIVNAVQWVWTTVCPCASSAEKPDAKKNAEGDKTKKADGSKETEKTEAVAKSKGIAKSKEGEKSKEAEKSKAPEKAAAGKKAEVEVEAEEDGLRPPKASSKSSKKDDDSGEFSETQKQAIVGVIRHNTPTEAFLNAQQMRCQGIEEDLRETNERLNELAGMIRDLRDGSKPSTSSSSSSAAKGSSILKPHASSSVKSSDASGKSSGKPKSGELVPTKGASKASKAESSDEESEVSGDESDVLPPLEETVRPRITVGPVPKGKPSAEPAIAPSVRKNRLEKAAEQIMIKAAMKGLAGSDATASDKEVSGPRLKKTGSTVKVEIEDPAEESEEEEEVVKVSASKEMKGAPKAGAKDDEDEDDAELAPAGPAVKPAPEKSKKDKAEAAGDAAEPVADGE